MRQVLFICILISFLAACSEPAQNPPPIDVTRRVISLDYCADQYVLGLVDRQEIAALSPDAGSSYSYLRDKAEGIPKVRPRAEDILLHRPDIVVRSYGGGVNITSFLNRAGIDVVQIGYASKLQDVKLVVRNAAKELGEAEKGETIVQNMEDRLSALSGIASPPSVLYLSSKGAVAGRFTMIDDLISRAGLQNFYSGSGWTGSIPLESLVFEKPDMIATGFFETSDLTSDIWTPTRHPVVQRTLSTTPTLNLPGAWISCSAWPLVDAVEALSTESKKIEVRGTP